MYNSKKITELWTKVSNKFLNFICCEENSAEAFKKIYRRYKRVGGKRTILSGENLLKAVN